MLGWSAILDNKERVTPHNSGTITIKIKSTVPLYTAVIREVTHITDESDTHNATFHKKFVKL